MTSPHKCVICKGPLTDQQVNRGRIMCEDCNPGGKHFSEHDPNREEVSHGEVRAFLPSVPKGGGTH